MISSGYLMFRTVVSPLATSTFQRLMIALNLADFDLTEGIEHYFRLAVSLILGQWARADDSLYWVVLP